MRNTDHWILRSTACMLLTHAGGDAIAQGAQAAPAVQTLAATPPAVIYSLVITAIIQVAFILSLNGIMRVLSTTKGRALLKGVSRSAILIAALVFSTSEASAQAYQGDGNAISDHQLFWILVVVNIFLFVVILIQVNLVRGMLRAFIGEPRTQEPAPAALGPSWATRTLRRLTRQVSMEKEEDILMHHEYDGIRELDNVLPPWWVWLFYGTIAWGVIYLINVHVINVWPDQRTEYVDEMAQAEADVAAYKATLTNIVDENTVTLSTDAGVLGNGKSVFNQFCTPCHGADAAGSETSVGPNLTDAYWIHGGGVKNVFRTISNGVPEKGMISWKSQLQPSEIAALASYILSLQGTGGAAQKAPQGDIWKDEAAPADSTAAPADTLVLPNDTARLALK